MLTESTHAYLHQTSYSFLKSFSLTILQHVLTITPILPLLFVYLFSWRLESLIGHWPIYLVDDPKFAGPEDSLSTFLYSSVLLSSCLTFLSILVFPFITFLRWRNYSKWWSMTLIAIYVLCWLLSRYDPAQRWQWYMD